MAGTKEGGKKAAKTNKLRHGEDFYIINGRKGGKAGHTGGFASNPILAKIAGQKGGRNSHRGFQYKYKAVQLIEFDPKKCLKRKGYQLCNVAEGYSIHTRHFPSCMHDAAYQKLTHTIHPLSTLPKNVSVPIYIKTLSKWGYVVVSHKGKIYDPQKNYKTLKGVEVLGWAECIDNIKVIKLERIKDEITE